MRRWPPGEPAAIIRRALAARMPPQSIEQRRVEDIGDRFQRVMRDTGKNDLLRFGHAADHLVRDELKVGHRLVADDEGGGDVEPHQHRTVERGRSPPGSASVRALARCADCASSGN